MNWLIYLYNYQVYLWGHLYAISKFLVHFKGELQRQNKLISSERPFKILQNETKIIKIGHAVLEIFNFKDWNLGDFTRKNDKKPKMLLF